MNFNKNYTIGDFIRAVLAIDNERDAKTFVEHYLELMKEPRIEDRLKIMRDNIGYCFGEWMSEDKIKMWMKLTGARHPYFDPLTNPSPAELFRIANELASKKINLDLNYKIQVKR